MLRACVNCDHQMVGSTTGWSIIKAMMRIGSPLFVHSECLASKWGGGAGGHLRRRNCGGAVRLAPAQVDDGTTRDVIDSDGVLTFVLSEHVGPADQSKWRRSPHRADGATFKPRQ